MIVDDNESFVIDPVKPTSQTDELGKLMGLIEVAKEHIYFISKTKPGKHMPKQFSRIIRIGYPSGILQIQEWKANLTENADIEKTIMIWSSGTRCIWTASEPYAERHGYEV